LALPLCGVCRNRSMMGEPLFMGDQFRLYSESPVKGNVLAYFAFEDVNKVKALAILVGICLAITGAISVTMTAAGLLSG